MCTPQLSVDSPFSSVKETSTLSPRYAVLDLTEPESFGHPLPENTSDVIFGAEGGAAMMSVGSERRSKERIVMIRIQVNIQY